MTEAELKREVLRLAYDAGWLVYHVPATTVRGSQGRGYPDLTLARNGVALWLELKGETGDVRHEQYKWQEQLPYGSAFIVRPSSLPQVERLLR